MPKNISVSKSATGAITKRRPPHKFRIGTRKSGKSAVLMSDDELKEIVNDNSKSRYHKKAVDVLRNRGIEVDWPKPLVKEAKGLEGVAEEFRLT